MPKSDDGSTVFDPEAQTRREFAEVRRPITGLARSTWLVARGERQVERPLVVAVISRLLHAMRNVLCAAVISTTLLLACAGPTSYVHPTYDFSLVQKVAVLPLENHAGDPQAAEKVRKMVVSEILAGGMVDVVDPGQVNRALVEARIENITRISAEEFKKLGEILGVQAFILGSVDNYERTNVGGSFFAEVAISLRAVDSATGTIIWSATAREGGVSTTGRLFGFGGDTLSEATEKAVRSAVTTLF